MGSLFKSLHAFLIVVFLGAPLSAAADVVLVMAEEDGCYWCAKWNEEVGGEYPITAEGRAAPLRRIDIHADIPPDLSFDDRLVYTPTFVLMQDGRERTSEELGERFKSNPTRIGHALRFIPGMVRTRLSLKNSDRVTIWRYAP